MTDYYVRSGGGNSNGGSTTYSLTSGGPADGANPTATDNVFLDANSGQLTINATFTCANFDCTGYTNTLSGSSASTITGGTFLLAAGMTYTYSGFTTVTGANAAGDVTITRAGKFTTQTFQINGAGEVFKLADALNVGTGTLTLSAGELNSQGFDIACGAFQSTGTSVRALTLTGSSVACSTSLSINGTNLTFAGPDDFTLFPSQATSGALISCGVVIPKAIISLAPSANTGRGGATLSPNDAATVRITELVVSGTPNANITCLPVIALTANAEIDTMVLPEGCQLVSSAYGTQRTVTTTDEISFDGCMIRDIAISGGPAIATNSIDLGNNSGITFQNFGPATHEIVGITKDDAGAALPSCTVIAFKEDGGVMKEVSRTTSDGTTGAYTLTTPDNDPEYLIVATKTSANRADAMNGIEPTVP